MERIILFKPQNRAGRFKLFIPFSLTEERAQLKKLNTSYYHPQQKLWSLVNTVENWERVQELFRGKFDLQEFQTNPKPPERTLSEKSEEVITSLSQKLILKAFSPSTIKNYTSSIKQFLGFFESRDLKELSKEEIESFVYHQIN